MRIGAILTLASGQSETDAADAEARRQRGERTNSLVKMDVLGASVLQRTLEKLHSLDALPVRVLTESNGTSQFLPPRSARSTAFVEAWEKAVGDLVEGGVDVLFLGRLGSHTDLDFTEILQFHKETQSALTQVYSSDGSLDMALVSARLMRDGHAGGYRRALSTLIQREKRFLYSGYVNPLRSVHDLHRLMQDGLNGVCQLRPVGREMSPGVWLAAGAQVDSTVRLAGPVFIGERARISAGCTVAGSSSIERDCAVDCGTTVRGSLVLQGTYVGLALDLNRVVAGDDALFHIDRNVEIGIHDARLIGSSVKSLPFLSGLASFLGNTWQRAH